MSTQHVLVPSEAAGMRETGCSLQDFSCSFSLVLAPSQQAKTRFHAFVQVAAGGLTALSRNYFDQIHFAVNYLAMLPGFFSFKNVWRPERLLPCTWQTKVYIYFPGCNFRHPLIILFYFLAIFFEWNWLLHDEEYLCLCILTIIKF